MIRFFFQKFTSLGGQALIEGVMMRSPHYFVLALRKSDKKILVKCSSYQALSGRFPILGKPLFRGIMLVLESMIQGTQALSYSAEIASSSKKSEKKLSTFLLLGSLAVAYSLGMLLFVVAPHFITVVLTRQIGSTIQSPFFHFIDGCLRMGVFLLYVAFISRMQDVRRLFQYHGAEHKAIYTFEAGDVLSVENARKYKTLHPRCGTSFLFFLVLVSIFVFSAILPLFHFNVIDPVLGHLRILLVKFFLMLPIAGFAYEFIKICAFRMKNPFFRFLIWPGLALQRLTTREPFDDQLEVALVALKKVLQLEKKSDPAFENFIKKCFEFEIHSLSELGEGEIFSSEFLEE